MKRVRAEYSQSWVRTNCWGDWLTTPRWRWRLLPDFSTAGVLGDLGTHVVDALLLFCRTLEPLDHEGFDVQTLTEAMEEKIIPYRSLSADFFDSEGRSVPVEAKARFLGETERGERFEGVLHLTWIDTTSLDRFYLEVEGSAGIASVDLSQDRVRAILHPHRTGEVERIEGPSLPSTYETFIHCIHDSGEIRHPLPTLETGVRVQETLDRLFPGVLPA